ncbi:metalloregulator ArsR/SmtB family transcription factor [Geodermatophilus sp. YIM 151500]|uniref:ArsR/SmtB family transcription factor n=1 Tax=Geodermatophilus sp. YIM 151500 TaxID=2984531 RepID=UPI0021E4A875|nr:metalloregulator ArsR/SmtB family transcription factor [Geodermatophilus sp. YIM 151500]MCV2489785.1 metalloregulator ArsR/SmtB family transcription factor [Geodermatophilus sp. YIM 151500]
MNATDLPTMCAALGDPTRWDILTQLGTGAKSASALARLLPVSRQAIGKHLDVLREAGLVVPERRGREVVYVAVGARLGALARELDRIGRSWEARLLRIKELAERPDPDGSSRR